MAHLFTVLCYIECSECDASVTFKGGPFAFPYKSAEKTDWYDSHKLGWLCPTCKTPHEEAEKEKMREWFHGKKKEA